MNQKNKLKYLIIGLFLDGIGIVTSSYVLPFFGDIADVVWAPLSAWLMTRMYLGKTGKTAGAISFIEEIIPGVDVVPIFTITWLYHYLFKKETIQETLDAEL